MEVMKRLLLLLSCTGALLGGAELSGVHTVYVLSMSKGLDQYLANRLANDHLFQVVTDPKLADAFLTDRVGESLAIETGGDFPTARAREAGSGRGESVKGGQRQGVSHQSPARRYGEQVGRPRGEQLVQPRQRHVFLVDAKSRQVVWSVYQLPKGSSAKELDRTASDIVSRLKRDLKGK